MLARDAAVALGVADRSWSLYNRREATSEAIAQKAAFDRLPIAHNAASAAAGHRKSSS